MLEHLDTTIAFSVVLLLLSLMITALVQMVVTLSGLRGRNLFWGVERLLRQVDPKLGPHAREVADRLLRHPAITHTWLSRAVAIRPEELVRLLRDLAHPQAVAGQPQIDPWYRQVLRKVVPGGLRELLARFFPHPMKGLSPVAQQALATLLPAPGGDAAAPNATQLAAVAAALRQALPEQAAIVDATVRRVEAEADELARRVDTWFDSLMDRTSERFKLHTRFITVLMTVLFVIVSHVDALAIFRQLSTSPKLVADLVQSSGAALSRAEEVFAQTGKGSGKALASEALRRMSETGGALGQAIKTECAKSTAAGQAGCSGGLLTRRDGEEWLAAHLPDAPDALRAYGEVFDQVAVQNIKDLGLSMTKLRGDLDLAQVRIFPKSLALARPLRLAPGREILGLLASMLLLSLGAPFWYNVLRKLSDLRPIVARRVEGEPLKGEPKKEG
jgi:hypothetical protein